MKDYQFLILPAFLGLVAGVSHGIVAHYANLPLSLTDQFLEIVVPIQE